MKCHFLVAVCALFFTAHSLKLLPQSSPNLSQEVEELAQQAQKYLQEQKPETAIPLLREIISLDPKNLSAHANLGVLLYFKESYVDAIPEMRTALDSQPGLWRIRALLGIAEKRTGDPIAAQSDLEQAFPHLDDNKIQKQAGLELIELDSSLWRSSSVPQ
jgi:tetratricopeptide (TPR) repeat protein